MSAGQFTTRCALATVLFGFVPSLSQAQETISIEEIRALKARIKQLEDKVSRQDRSQQAVRANHRHMENEIKRVAHGSSPTSSTTTAIEPRFGGRDLIEFPTFAEGPGRPPVRTGPLGTSTPDPGRKPEHWYERLSLRGYTQGRFNGFVNGSPGARELYRLPGDRSVGKDQNFLLRRVRVILSGGGGHPHAAAVELLASRRFSGQEGLRQTFLRQGMFSR